MPTPYLLTALLSVLLISSAAARAADGNAEHPSSLPETASRIAAASNTAHNQPLCKAVQPFYWEIGDRHAALASGSEGAGAPQAQTQMLIASASKWIFGAYVLQLKHGQLDDRDVSALSMRSGYSSLRYEACVRAGRRRADLTVSDCLNQRHLLGGSNAEFHPEQVGEFFYNGGHFQKLAVELGLGNDDASHLQQDIGARIGSEIEFHYDSPQLAAGIQMSAGAYAQFLRKILSGGLAMRDALGTHAVCTSISRCDSALSTPIPASERWDYSLAHWVEDDPVMGDGAFSSPGAFGFYPWIDASKQYYGVLARYNQRLVASQGSVQCGRLIRKAWLSGMPQ